MTESLPKETVERIEKEAERRYPIPKEEDRYPLWTDSAQLTVEFLQARKQGYIAGATCEALRAREEMRVEKLQHEDTFLKMMEARGRISELEAEIISLKADKSIGKDNL